MTLASPLPSFKVLHDEQRYLFHLNKSAASHRCELEKIFTSTRSKKEQRLSRLKDDEQMMRTELSLLWLYSDIPTHSLYQRYSFLEAAHSSIKLDLLYIEQKSKPPVDISLILLNLIITQSFHLIVLDGCLHNLSQDYPRLRWILEQYQVTLCLLVDQ